MVDIPFHSEQTLAELAKYDTPTVCNAVELWDRRPRQTGYLNHHLEACFPELPPMVGYALTSTFRSMRAPQGGDVYGSLTKQVEAFAEFPGPPVIVFQDLDEPVSAATFGEVMCTTYQAFGSAGLITSGTGRDLDQVAALNYPCFTAGTTCAHGYCHILTINQPVTVGGMTVGPGELLHGDRNGVTTIPHEIASEVPGVCQEIMDAEEIVLGYLRGGQVEPRGFDAARRECGEIIARLGRRLRGED